MARSALILLAIVLAACQADDKPARLSAAAVTQGQAKAVISFPDPPPACVAKIGRVRIGDEPWVITFKRWQIVADNRDRQADDCTAWFAEMKQKYGSAR